MTDEEVVIGERYVARVGDILKTVTVLRRAEGGWSVLDHEETFERLTADQLICSGTIRGTILRTERGR